MSKISDLTELLIPANADLIAIVDDSETDVNIKTKRIRIDNLGVPGIPGADGVDGVDGVGVPVGGTTGQVLAKASNTDYDTGWVNQASTSSIKVAILEDRKTLGENGGTFTSGDFVKRVFSHKLDPFNFVTLTSDEFRIDETGVFLLHIQAPAFSVNSHLAKLVQVGAPDVDLAQSQNRRNPAGTMDSAFVEHILTVSDTTLYYKVMHRCETTKTTDGFGTITSTGAYEKYTTLKITKLGEL